MEIHIKSFAYEECSTASVALKDFKTNLAGPGLLSGTLRWFKDATNKVAGLLQKDGRRKPSIMWYTLLSPLYNQNTTKEQFQKTEVQALALPCDFVQ